MITKTELLAWLATLPEDALVGVDDGGLALEATHNEKSIAYVEIGGITSMLCDGCGSAVTEIVGCPDGAEICRDCFNAGQH